MPASLAGRIGVESAATAASSGTTGSLVLLISVGGAVRGHCDAHSGTLPATVVTTCGRDKLDSAMDNKEHGGIRRGELLCDVSMH